MHRQKNIFDKIGSLIPGYTGYAEREGRRQCDKILREEISSKLNSIEKLLEARIENIIKEKTHKELNDFEKCRKKINTLSSKIKFAPYGNSGFFNDAQIKENELLEVYQKDIALLDFTKEMEANIKNEQHAKIIVKIEKLETLLENRNQLIKEYK